MKLKEGFTLRKLGGDYVLEPIDVVDFNKLISFNESAAFLWEKFENVDFTLEQMVDALIEHYGISNELAEKDSRNLLNDWQKIGLVE